MSLLNELRRRNVIRVGTAYVVLAWLVIQVVETIFPAFGMGDASVRIAAILGLVGFFPTLIFAWVFEITPDGVRKESEIDRGASITQKTGKLLDKIILVILTIAVLYFMIDKFVFAEQREVSIAATAREEGRFNAMGRSIASPSIAVLPFADMSVKGDQEYFADGISEELLNLLAKIPDLRVISRTSAFSFKDKDLEITEIAERLQVGHILEGSVRMAGKEVRITAQLIETTTDSHLWSETYDRNMDNIFVIQDEIAAAVVNELEGRLLSPEASSKAPSAEAYALYLRASYLSDQMSEQSLEKARDMVMQVLEVDQNYVDALILLSHIYDRMVSLQMINSDEARQLSAAAARKALAYAPDSARVNDLMAWIVQRDEGDLVQAAAYLQRALELEPTRVPSIANVALFLGSLGRHEEAIELSLYHVSRDPANSVAFNNLGMQYRFSRQYDKAVEAFRIAQELNPGGFGINYELAVSLLLKDDIESAELAIANESSEVFRQLGSALILHAKGDDDASEQLAQALIDKFGPQLGYYIGQLMAYRERIDDAFFWIDAAIEAGDGEFKATTTEPLLNNLREDSRWPKLLERVGRAPRQLDAIEFRITLPQG